MLQTLYIAKTIYGISDIKINEKYMQELNKVIIEDLMMYLMKMKMIVLQLMLKKSMILF